MNKEILTAIFFSLKQSEKACKALFEGGYHCKEVSLIITAETWKKHFLHTASDIRSPEKGMYQPPCHCSIQDHEKPSGLKDVIKLARFMPGLDILVAGPIGQHMDTCGPTGICAGILGAFQRWGMSPSLSLHYEQEVMGGGIMIGVQPRETTEVSPISSHWRQQKGAHIYLTQSSNAMRV